MSQIEELMQELCPLGVPFQELAAISRTLPGLSGKSKGDFSDGNVRYVSYKNAFANIAVDQLAPDYVKVGPDEKQNHLQLGDVVITGSSESLGEVGMSSVIDTEPAEPLYLNSFCFIVRFNDPTILIPGFSKYLFRAESVRSQIRKAASGVTRINVSKPRFAKIRIPIPPLDVQREIAKVLDQFTLLEAELEVELEAELKARRQQYAHYRDSLVDNADGPAVALGEIGTFIRGRRFTKKDVVEGVSRASIMVRSIRATGLPRPKRSAKCDRTWPTSSVTPSRAM